VSGRIACCFRTDLRFADVEKSDKRLLLNIAKMEQEWFLCTPIEETKYFIKKCHAEVREEKMPGVEFLRHNTLWATMERHPAMLCEIHTVGCLPSQNCTPKNPQITCRSTGPGALSPKQCRQLNSEPTPPTTTGKYL